MGEYSWPKIEWRQRHKGKESKKDTRSWRECFQAGTCINCLIRGGGGT